MARWFRIYQKKRGHRRTGSSQLGSLGEALFFAVFFVAGAVFFGMMFATLVIPEWRANRQFMETECTIDGTFVEVVSTADASIAYTPQVDIHYQVAGARYDVATYDIRRSHFASHEAAERALEPFSRGSSSRCWYDPMNPGEAVVVQGYSVFLYSLLLVPVGFIVIGGGGLLYTLLHWGTSAERRASLTQRAARIDLFETTAAPEGFPSVPGAGNLTNSPGTTLAYRLPVGAAPGWALFAALVACLIWNGVVVMFLVMVVRGHLAGDPNWGLTLFILPLVLIGLGLIYYLAHQFLKTTGVGPTRVEISHHPLKPGRNYEVFISQAGRLSINSLEVMLVCAEKATYRQGTDTRTERRQVYLESIFRRDEFEIQPDRPFESRCGLRVPASAMHSFKADHNEIHWSLRVRGNVAGWPDFEREFPIVVHPMSAEALVS